MRGEVGAQPREFLAAGPAPGHTSAPMCEFVARVVAGLVGPSTVEHVEASGSPIERVPHAGITVRTRERGNAAVDVATGTSTGGLRDASFRPVRQAGLKVGEPMVPLGREGWPALTDSGPEVGPEDVPA